MMTTANSASATVIGKKVWAAIWSKRRATWKAARVKSRNQSREA